MKHWLCLLALGVCLLAFSCSEETNLVIPEEELVPVLVDIHLAEAMAQKLYGELKDTISQTYYEQVFTIHHITREQFDEAYQQLQDDPKLMFQVYEKVLEEINRQEAQVK